MLDVMVPGRFASRTTRIACRRRGASAAGCSCRCTSARLPGTWDESNAGHVHIANCVTWTAITGEPLPPTMISAELYTAYGLPGFDPSDEEKGGVAPPEILARIDSISAIEGARRQLATRVTTVAGVGPVTTSIVAA